MQTPDLQCWRFVCILTLAILTGCAPRFDWRTVTDSVAGYSVLMPGRPTRMNRDVLVAGQTMQMQVAQTESGDALFAVGVIKLPTRDRKLRDAALQFLKGGLARSFAEPLPGRPEDRTVTVKGTTDPAAEWARRAVVSGDSVPRELRVQFVTADDRVFQVAVLSHGELPADTVDTFLSSFTVFAR